IGEDVAYHRVEPDEVVGQVRDQVGEDIRQGEQARPGVEPEPLVRKRSELPAGPVGLLEHRDLVAGGREAYRGGEPADPGPDHDRPHGTVLPFHRRAPRRCRYRDSPTRYASRPTETGWASASGRTRPPVARAVTTRPSTPNPYAVSAGQRVTGSSSTGPTYSTSSSTTTAGCTPAHSDLAYPSRSAGHDEYMRQLASREKSARSIRPPARFTAWASATSSSTASRTAACPPARSYPARVSSRNCPPAAASDGRREARIAGSDRNVRIDHGNSGWTSRSEPVTASSLGQAESRSDPVRRPTAWASASGWSTTSASTNASTATSGTAAASCWHAYGLPSQ